MPTLIAIKCVKQSYSPNEGIQVMMETFRHMVNDCLRIGLGSNVSTMKKLCNFCYPALAEYNIISYYKLCAISHAAGMLANRKKSIKRDLQPRHTYATRPLLISCYGFKVLNGILKVPVGSKQYFEIPLNRHVRKILSDPSLRVRSFTLAASNIVSICYSKEVTEIECASVQGIDRNLRNLTVGNHENVTQYDLTKTVDLVENTRSIIRSFKRNDVRIRKKIASKYGRRRAERIRQLMHHVSKAVVEKAREQKTTITFEDIRFIRRLYQSGNGQGRNYRFKLNGWSFAEIKRQIEYKAAWEGVPVIQLSVTETRGTSQLCPRCGKKITQEDRRQLWCAECKRWMDRDVVAAMNLSIKGRSRLDRSQGAASEAMRGNPVFAKEPVILRVDAAKLTCRRKPVG